MHKSIIALGIESSCDDTSIGVIKVTRKDNILVSEKLGLVHYLKKNSIKATAVSCRKLRRVPTQKEWIHALK